MRVWVIEMLAAMFDTGASHALDTKPYPIAGIWAFVAPSDDRAARPSPDEIESRCRRSPGVVHNDGLSVYFNPGDEVDGNLPLQPGFIGRCEIVGFGLERCESLDAETGSELKTFLYSYAMLDADTIYTCNVEAGSPTPQQDTCGTLHRCDAAYFKDTPTVSGEPFDIYQRPTFTAGLTRRAYVEELRLKLKPFTDPEADYDAVMKSFRPTEADYRAAFTDDVEDSVMAQYEAAWSSGQMSFSVKPGQTEIEIVPATIEDLRNQTGPSVDLPGGYGTAAQKMETGHITHFVRFTEPNEPRGMSLSGFQKINGRWVIFPKPWRVLE